jgi:Tol biopolymer transport system component
MTSRNASSDDFDRLMRQWMDSDARVGEPEHLLEHLLERTAHTRRIPRWLLVERWLPTSTTTRLHAAPRLALVAVLIALLVAAVAIALTVGGPRRLPAPFGPAANGLIAYDTFAQIFVSTPDGGQVRLLVDGIPNAAAATFSPDGTRIAFWGDDSPDSLYVVNADGSEVRKLSGDLWIATNLPPTWSPDGRFIAFSAETGPDREDEAIYAVAASGGDPRRVGEQLPVRALNPAWSPDGTWIAFIGMPKSGPEVLEIWAVRPDGGDAHQLPTTDDVESAQPQWAPRVNPQRLAYAAIGDAGEQDVFVLDVDSGVETLISDDPAREEFPTWSPDGSRVAWLLDGPNAKELRVASVPDGAVVATVPAGTMSMPPAWSPDGTKIYGSDEGKRSITVVTVDGSAPAVLIPHPAGQSLPTWQRLAP